MSLNITIVGGRPSRCSIRVRAVLALLVKLSHRKGAAPSACRTSHAMG